jgi:hypothetical protein
MIHMKWTKRLYRPLSHFLPIYGGMRTTYYRPVKDILNSINQQFVGEFCMILKQIWVNENTKNPQVPCSTCSFPGRLVSVWGFFKWKHCSYSLIQSNNLYLIIVIVIIIMIMIIIIPERFDTSVHKLTR